MKYCGEKVINAMRQVASSKELSPWEGNFISSIQVAYEKWGSLTEGQRRILQKLADKHSPDNLAKASVWKKNFSSDMHRDFTTMLAYYEANPPYFQDVISQIEDDSDYIPNRKLYHSMCENKYAKRVLATANTAPIYAIGSLVKVRDTSNIPSNLSGLRNKCAIVVEHFKTIVSAAKGARRVSILPLGQTELILAEERWLKVAK